MSLYQSFFLNLIKKIILMISIRMHFLENRHNYYIRILLYKKDFYFLKYNFFKKKRFKNEDKFKKFFLKMDAVTKETTTCSGCRDGILNQLGHMDEGGCLYTEIEENDRCSNEIKTKNDILKNI